jgi:DNA-binding transcriptional LysR family regulator
MLDRLTLDQLRVLMAVADSGSFSAAGRRLARVQSAVSQSVQSLETALGIPLFDRTGKTPVLTDAGAVMLREARHLVHGADQLRAHAAGIAAGIEPELALAVDAVLPNAPLMASLKALSETFPCLPVTLFTENLGGALQRLHDGAARLAIFPSFLPGADGLDDEFLASIDLVPVVAADHPLAAVPAPLSRESLRDHVQLVLTDRTQVTAGMSGNILSTRIWRFADLGTRLDYLLDGFGWCHMPVHLVEPHIAAGRLKRLDIQGSSGFALSLHVFHEPARAPGRAGRWFIDDLRRQLAGRDAADQPQQPSTRLAPPRHAGANRAKRLQAARKRTKRGS